MKDKPYESNILHYLKASRASESELRELLIEAAALFRFYESSHRIRGPEHFEKANRNADIAARIEIALKKGS